ncbi:hypothetical protein NP590_00280 [Methylomonas sp. SURF-2]|uniref:Toxin CptA n=1 Tax=Methylomonas subterranea TaxID=2952225 RepID=A0ABT1TAM4_9GAMM|nr:protein YgfX [Methylomonas sp. SURF-2]MCQ8102523.1 hypothetical protein [Methylomonas sp. SURF-2]
MEQSFQASHFFVIVPSRRLRWLVDSLHLLAFLACGLNGLPVFQRMLLCVAVTIAWAVRHAARKTSTPSLRYTKNQGWEIALDGGDYVAIEVLNDTVISPWAVFLCFKADALSTTSLIIANDALAVDDFRRLRVQLMLSGCGQN